MPVHVKGYASPALVLLAYDWPAAAQRSDFRGFGIERCQGIGGEERSWLPDPNSKQSEQPIRTFYCWDATIGARDRGASFRYRVVPVIGANDQLRMLEHEAAQIEVRVP
jgi:hypothetical protein